MPALPWGVRSGECKVRQTEVARHASSRALQPSRRTFNPKCLLGLPRLDLVQASQKTARMHGHRCEVVSGILCYHFAVSSMTMSSTTA